MGHTRNKGQKVLLADVGNVNASIAFPSLRLLFLEVAALGSGDPLGNAVCGRSLTKAWASREPNPTLISPTRAKNGGTSPLENPTQLWGT